MPQTIRMVGGKAQVQASLPNRLYESMTRVLVGQFTVRVWRSLPAFGKGPDSDVLDALTLLPARTAKEIADVLDAIEGVEAYEVLDAGGNGVVVYPDWK